MIDFKEEIKRFKPSLDVDNIEDAIAKTDLTDMNDIMFELLKDGVVRRQNDAYSMGMKNGL
ncbi:MAG: hypothetical protein Q4B86_03005 [Eubacteriales bacterium]|nr:hypothetical protein [Eubacteriales bacterium]